MAAIVVVAGIAFIALRGQTWESSAKVILVPAASDASDRGAALETWDSSGTIGTYEELIGSSGMLAVASDPSTSIDVRPVPDSRVIGVTAKGERASVQGDLIGVLLAAKQRGLKLDDLWTLQTLEEPGAPAPAGPSDFALLVATLALAVVGGLAVYVLLGAIRNRMSQPTLHPVAAADGNHEPERRPPLPAARTARVGGPPAREPRS